MVTIKNVKEELNKHLGDEVTIKYNLGRNKYEKYNGIIKETYNKIFLIETNGIKKSFSYVDVLTKNVKISIKN